MNKQQRYILRNGDGFTYIFDRSGLAMMFRHWRNAGAYIEYMGAQRWHITQGNGSADIFPAI